MTGRGRRCGLWLRSLGASAMLLALCGQAWAGGSAPAPPALPSGGVVKSGAVAVTSSPAALTVTQSTPKAVIDWSSFSIGAGGQVQFNNGSGATLNRVIGPAVSSIDGLLSATGSVYLINPNGVIIGKHGVVQTGGRFVASTLGLSDSQFLAGGDLAFSGASGAAVINLGHVGSLGGDVVLMAATVDNEGVIDAGGGEVGLLAGYSVTLRDQALDDGKFVIDVGGAATSATNGGGVEAVQVELRANGGNVYALAGNTGSVIKADGVAAHDGKVFLIAEGGATIAEIPGALSNTVAGAGAITAVAYNHSTTGPEVISGTRP